MEFGSIIQFLENKTILITGAAGFLGKTFVEKILRVQPNVKKLYLLLRAADAKAAAERLHNEVIGKDLFKVLKEKWGANEFNSLISRKITPIAGDICFEDLGVKDSNLREKMMSELDIVINFAATTNFDERYDVALAINTMGVKHVLCFAKRCVNLKVYVHISTAYVCGESSGLILENPYRMGETLNGTTGLDITEEKKLVEEKLKELRAEGATEAAIEVVMKDMGIKRAQTYGWPNTYVFTKAMGEMLVGHLKENLSVVTIRPTMVTSTYKEPFPSWLEGIKTIDALTVGYGKGKITCFLADETAIVDVIPVDMVVNATIVAMVAHANRPSDIIYHVGSSVKNPVRYCNLHDYGYRYFTQKPWIGKDGKPVKVKRCKVLTSMESFHGYMAVRYLLLLKGLELANIAFCKCFQSTYSDFDRKIKLVMQLVELYRPYLFFRAVFDDTNTEKLRMAVRDNGLETDVFFFDPTSINWNDYFINTHGPGVVKCARRR